MGDFSHLSENNQGQMVNVGAKQSSQRCAKAHGVLSISQVCADKLNDDMLREIFSTARIAGINAAKQTALLIPFCHQIPLSYVRINVEFVRSEKKFFIAAETQTNATTGVEMEALVALQIAATTIYDMLKAQDPGAILGPFSLTYKSGGKDGPWPSTTNPRN